MHKPILAILIIFTTPIYSMEKYSPYIVYDIDITTIESNYSLAIKLSQKYPCIKLSQQDRPSHQSSNIKPMLEHDTATLKATKRVIKVKNNPQQRKPHYAISICDTGHTQDGNGDVYAPIQMAAAYTSKLINRILIIDENLNKRPTAVNDYYNNGNGSIFYPKNNPELFALFNGEIITHDKIPNNELWNFVQDSKNDINLALYNINIENIDATNKRKLNIISLFYNFIPTVFILSGNKKQHQDTACSLIDYITKTAQQVISLFYAPRPSSKKQSSPHASSSRSRASSSSSDETKLLRQELKTNCNIYTSSSESQLSSSGRNYAHDIYKASSSNSSDSDLSDFKQNI